MGYELPDIDVKDTRKNLRKFGKGEDIVEVWEENGQDVWLEQWVEDFLDEASGEVVSIQRHEWHRVAIEESPWRKEEDNDETGTQERETVEVSDESKNNPYWEEVKRKVRIRDGHSCQMCGKTYNLEIHHLKYKINGVSIIGKELDHLDCLITLCEDCHQKVHNR